ncbi:MAG TPA: hypothetical protein VG407_05925 [Caulobacteraceae bacterium]|jgi:hypothetical protein|nr:hypothetical protein [Caulobacteraceae bacterium]
MTRGWIGAAALALALAAGCASAAAQETPAQTPPPPAPVDLTAGVTIADVRVVAADAGCTVERVKDDEASGFTVEMTCSDDRHPWFEGLRCAGEGDARLCTEYEIGMSFRAESAAATLKLAPSLCFKYICAVADDDVLTFTRMDFTYGGVTRDHLTQSVKVILEISADQIEPAIWPDPKPKP